MCDNSTDQTETNDQALRRLMKAAGMTQQATAKLLGVDPSTLRRWIGKGKTAIPCPDWAPRLLFFEIAERNGPDDEPTGIER